MKRCGWLLSAAMLLLSCGNPLRDLDPSLSTVRLRVAGGADGSRTVVPNFDAIVDEVEFRLSSDEGYDAPEPYIDTAAPWQAAFSVPVGTWDFAVIARKNGVQIGGGSKNDVSLAAGLSEPLEIAVTIGPAAAEGSARLALRLPASLGITYVRGRIEETGAEEQQTLTTSGTDLVGTLSFSGLPSGTYALILTFRRGGDSGNVAGVFREKIIVVGGYESASWVTAEGTLAAERIFTAQEFLAATETLSGLSIDPGVFATSSFNPTRHSYPLPAFASLPGELTVTATASAPTGEQYLEYSWNGGPFQEIRSGVSSPGLAADAFNELTVRVTAPDRATRTLYHVTFGTRDRTFVEDFETGTDGWTSDGGDTWFLDSSNHSSGTYSLRMSAEVGSWTFYDGIHYSWGESVQPRYVSFRLMRTGTALPWINIGGDTTSSKGGAIHFIWDDAWGNQTQTVNAMAVEAADGVKRKTATGIADTPFHLIEFRNIDFPSQTYDFYVDGMPIASGVAFKDFTASFTRLYVSLGYYGGPVIYLDDIEMH